MRQSIKGFTTKFANARFSYLFSSIILLLMLRPFLEGFTALRNITTIFIWFILISCGWAVHEKKRHRMIFLGIVILAILTDFLDRFLPDAAIRLVPNIVGIIVFSYIVAVIFLYLIRQEEVTADMIMAAASEYMLIGIMFSYIYSLIEAVYPGSFNLQSSQGDPSVFLYFSFVTLTTTGYGDILPVSVQARSFAILEQVTGQLFVAVAVARLVGLYTARKQN
jgi:hypothetical protein